MSNKKGLIEIRPMENKVKKNERMKYESVN